uniref:Uncharacterized protein n=1 Tax=Craspedostauros australis TaxID=1486917 RepID=A0A7R9WQB6_9STRA|mmetsp:Transcript_15412/g.42637  ORF Transcript_15412/g.42637 Transcript_15412/m.42637 type:complete len:229 (+) Transcript_15412:117-803(+)|eukprot:CAMPEP_0198120680 /NCGR_PEP_ID=MMETSP1442-20131203/29842_1 /TAXON_ID= /ORGANISM="Craspedostauros australis, Strain CCMP3328" /LENGTH=228 /DNA_ID=CAMNT_0043779357 /DNA_START=111 /DNA_END=797 /DNA_ORIENTATION=+
MAFNSVYNRMMGLVRNDEEVPASMACSNEILTLRECVKDEQGDEKCGTEFWDLQVCQADLRVSMTEKARIRMGVAKYNEHVKMVEEAEGAEKAAEILAMPKKIQADTYAKKMLWNVAKGKHPKGVPKPDWSQADLTRYEMGEAAYNDAASVLVAEFGLAVADQLVDAKKEQDSFEAAINLVAPGSIPARPSEQEIKASIQAKYPEFKLDGTDSMASIFAAIHKERSAA